MSAHRKDFIFKMWYRNKVNWLGTVKKYCIFTKDATFPPDGLFFKVEQRTSTCTFSYLQFFYVCLSHTKYFSWFETRGWDSQKRWVKKEWQGEDGRLRRAACDVENGNGDEKRPDSEMSSPVETGERKPSLLQTIVLSDRIVVSGASKCF